MKTTIITATTLANAIKAFGIGFVATVIAGSQSGYVLRYVMRAVRVGLGLQPLHQAALVPASLSQRSCCRSARPAMSDRGWRLDWRADNRG
ncbi:hypothetical protein [Botrimarina hoheduenensis]|uniref:Uncharacterized protein n=1 Tax=Botrimarina hoheduenensis TaxID=2528000 RepID=A0A5C5WB15_9BACT|nr:hypothetical protein [Botrimarina hoheduenensis]TWT46802.1 hypothetical protein Pla111_19040 [Botrimarina hoheduenensis]